VNLCAAGESHLLLVAERALFSLEEDHALEHGLHTNSVRRCWKNKAEQATHLEEEPGTHDGQTLGGILLLLLALLCLLARVGKSWSTHALISHDQQSRSSVYLLGTDPHNAGTKAAQPRCPTYSKALEKQSQRAAT
jgi:hypothetical protein